MHRFPLRLANASTNSHGLISAVRETSDKTSFSFTGSVPLWERESFLSSASRATVFVPTKSISVAAAPCVSVIPWPTAIDRTALPRSLRAKGAQSIIALLPNAETALYSRVFFATFCPSNARTVVSHGSFKYAIRSSESAFLSLSTSLTSTRRTSLAKGSVLAAVITSSPVHVRPEKVSELKDISPIFDKRANKRFITVSRLSSSSPAMRYTGKRLDCFDWVAIDAVYFIVRIEMLVWLKLHTTSPWRSVRNTSTSRDSSKETVFAAGCP